MINISNELFDEVIAALERAAITAIDDEDTEYFVQIAVKLEKGETHH